MEHHTRTKPLSVARTLFHLSGVLIPVIYVGLGKGPVLAITCAALVLVTLAEALRLRGAIHLAFVQSHLKKEEGRRPTGSFFYLVSCIAVILLFSKPVALASILVLAIADPFSSLLGSKWGRTPFFGKTLEGTGAFLCSAFIVLACFPFPWYRVAAAAIAAAGAELFSSRLIDDNLTIPLVCGLTLALLGA